ncbi:MAG: nucleotidyltransferase domain-containing protein [Candidatus Geothermarchaeales archaeon]
MIDLNLLSAKGAMNLLQRLSVGDARFKDLNKIVPNTRTLTKRLKELEAAGLITKVGGTYAVSDRGFKILMRFLDLEHNPLRWINEGEFLKIRYDWMRVSLKGLLDLFHDEYGDELVSFVLYGSSVRDDFEPGKSDIDLLYIVEDSVEGPWEREESVFKRFRSTLGYRASDRWLRSHGFYGYPDVTTVPLRKGYSMGFHPAYLDMLPHRAILYDKEGFFKGFLARLRERLNALGATRIEYADRTWFWSLKSDMFAGEPVKSL